MDDKFPNAMSFVNRTRGGGPGINVVENFHERRAMPSLAVEGAVELVGDETDFRHGHLNWVIV
jgi:hypothetical protein